MLRTDLIEDLEGLEPLTPAWDELAVAAQLPYSAPGWLLSWWRQAAPAGAQLRAVAVREGEELIGLAPFHVTSGAAGGALRPLGSGMCTGVTPLARPGREEVVASAVAPALAGAGAATVGFEGIPIDSAWPELLSAAWPGGPGRLHEEERMPSPTLALDGRTFEEWFASKSSGFRQRMRYYRRRLEARGAELTVVQGRKALAEAVAGFAELHRERWAGRGGSGVLTDGVAKAVADAARSLPSDRFRLVAALAEGRPVAASLFLAAGGEVNYWLGGFDEAWADTRPQMHVILAAIEHAMGAGDRRFDLGAGGQDYKYRFADGEEMLRWMTLVPPGARRRRVEAGLALGRARRGLAGRLTPRQKMLLKRLLRRRP